MKNLIAIGLVVMVLLAFVSFVGAQPQDKVLQFKLSEDQMAAIKACYPGTDIAGGWVDSAAFANLMQLLDKCYQAEPTKAPKPTISKNPGLKRYVSPRQQRGIGSTGKK